MHDGISVSFAAPGNSCCTSAGFAGSLRATEGVFVVERSSISLNTCRLSLKIRRGVRLSLLLVWLMLCCGCFNSNSPRLPQSRPWLPEQENAAFEQQYPFSDPDIGPSTDANPRGYDRPRSSARRAAEQRVFQGLPAGPESIPPGAPSTRRNSYDSVF
ncbi:MAG: hypothetical protein WCK86_24040 [Planctomycetia bacterium]